MIFVTVGAQMPFDRLMKSVDAWAAKAGRTTDVFAQTSHDCWQPRHIEHCAHLNASEFEQYAAGADLIVGHAGMGTILTAMQHAKPLLVLPRRGHLSETRNDHQMATARRFAERTPLAIAWDAHDLPAMLDAADRIAPMPRIGGYASESLLMALRNAIQPNAMPFTSQWSGASAGSDAQPIRFEQPDELRKAA